MEWNTSLKETNVTYSLHELIICIVINQYYTKYVSVFNIHVIGFKRTKAVVFK
jgi:hypothetical protein